MGCRWIIFLIALLVSATAEAYDCATEVTSVVRNLSEFESANYGYPGLSHITVAGYFIHGLKEVEMWIQTAAPGFGTPIHRHSCEEIFFILKGSGTLYIAPDSDKEYPGSPQKYPFSANSTFTIPVNAVHQAMNTDEHEDLQLLVVISKPPVNLVVYQDWFTPHTAAKLAFPISWDERCYEKPSMKEEL